MSWKDKWTALMWRITFPGEAMPLEILPSNYARLPEEEPKTKLEDALTKAVMMDMEIYPSAWEKTDSRWCYDDTLYENKEANVKIILDGVRKESCTINGTEVGKENREKLTKAFNNRFGVEVLERLLDRIEKVQTITPEEIVQESRPKLVDPFKEGPMLTLSKHLEALKAAANKGKSLPPPPRKLIAGPVSPQGVIGTKAAITTWKGKDIRNLNVHELDEVLNYSKAAFCDHSFGREF